MSDEPKPNKSELIPSINRSLARKKSGLVKRGLELIYELQNQQVRVLIGNFDDAINDLFSELIKEVIKNKYDLKVVLSFYGEEILELADKESVDIFILIISNIRFRPFYPPQERMEKSLQLINQIKRTYGRPVIVLSGLGENYSSLIARAKIAADFFFPLPCAPVAFMEAIEKCLPEMADFRGIISLLLPYYLDESFLKIFQNIGFRVLWADSQETTEVTIMENEPDLAIEWQHGPDDFPIRDLLKKHGRETPVILLLNWSPQLHADDFEELGYAGCVNVPYKLGKLMRLFHRHLTDGKKSVLERMCDWADVELDISN